MGMNRLARVSWYHSQQFWGEDKSYTGDLKPREGLGVLWKWGQVGMLGGQHLPRLVMKGQS